MGVVIWVATVITALLHLLSVLHSCCKAYNELFSYAFNAIGVFDIDLFLLVSASFLQVCHSCRGGHGWLTAFELPQRKEAQDPGLVVLAAGGL